MRSWSFSVCGGVVVVPVVVEPVVVPVPPDAVPVEATDVEVAVPVAVDRPPEENDLALPLLRGEVRIGE